MIPLTRLNGSPIYLNSDLIKYAEASPDTMITLVHGEKILVRESCEDLLHRMSEYRVQILRAVAQSLPHALELHNATAAAGAQSAFDHLAEERQETFPPDPAAIHRRRPQQF
ncbi:MAG: flagellar FlbD family protein [Acidobacteriaceae bacterium]